MSERKTSTIGILALTAAAAISLSGPGACLNPQTGTCAPIEKFLGHKCPSGWIPLDSCESGNPVPVPTPIPTQAPIPTPIPVPTALPIPPISGPGNMCVSYVDITCGPWGCALVVDGEVIRRYARPDSNDQHMTSLAWYGTYISGGN